MSEYPSEFRRSPMNGRWVLFAKGRAKRPHEFAKPQDQSSKTDPFDPANIPQKDISDALPNRDGWKVLAIRNAFPFLTPGDDPDVRGKIRDGFGYHEIIIHSPDPDQDFEQFETAQTELVLEMYIRRYRELAAQPHIKHVQIFTNRGPESGASVRHPHSQIVAMPVVPSYVQRLVETAREFHQETGKDLAEDELTRERDRQERLVEESAHFIVYCPFAPHADYQVRILPKRTHHRFDQMTDEERTDLAGIINTTYRRLDRVAGIPPYNAFIRTAPVATKGEAGLSWHIDIIPHLSTPGGMELATGLDVITVAPEDAAAALRQDS